MQETEIKDEESSVRNSVLENMHQQLLEALRHREQEVIRYLAILGPALGGFIWLLQSDKTGEKVFIIGTIGVQLLLLLGAAYSLALGYNYRYITLELAKLENHLKIRDFVLVGWPRSSKEFMGRYKLFCCIPWCAPPEVIKIFWISFLVGIVGVTVASIYKLNTMPLIIIEGGILCFFVGWLLPIHFGTKLQKQCKKENF
jgi:hypothetical protein